MFADQLIRTPETRCKTGGGVTGAADPAEKLVPVGRDLHQSENSISAGDRFYFYFNVLALATNISLQNIFF